MLKDKTDEYDSRIMTNQCGEVKTAQSSLNEILDDQIRRTSEHLTRLMQVKHKLKHLAPETLELVKEIQLLGIYY